MSELYATPEYADADQRIYLMNRFHIESFDVRKEDAALLVAASDLLKASKELLRAQGAFNLTESWASCAETLRAAIAKAEGQ